METTSFKATHNFIDHWWLILLSGVLLVGMGVWVILMPVQSYVALSFVFSIIILCAGVFEITFSIINYNALNGWGWTFTGGTIDVAIGIYLLSYPGVTMAVLPLIVGFWLFFRGIVAVGNAIDIRRYGFSHWGWLLFTGIIITLFASLIFVNPAFGIVNVIIGTELAFILAGIFRVILSLRLRKLKNP